MDLNDFDFTSEEFKNLPEEEKKKVIRNLVSARAANTQAALFNPSTQQIVGIDELVEQAGEEAVVDMIYNSLKDAKMESVSLESHEIKKLLDKAAKGQCSESELTMLGFIADQVMSSDAMHAQKILLDFIADLVEFARNDRHFDIRLGDIFVPIMTLCFSSVLASDNSGLDNYSASDATTLSKMFDAIAEDVYDTWKASCSELPGPGFVFMGLLHAAIKILKENDFVLPPNEKMEELFGIEEANENASTFKDTFGSEFDNNSFKSSEDKEMRNLLKE